MQFEPYKKYFFKEAFLKGDVEKAIRLANKIIGRKIGKKIYTSTLPSDFIKSGVGKMHGMLSTISDGRQIRYNWIFNDNSAKIVSIDVWNSLKIQPDLTIETDSLNIVKLIDVIVATLNNKKPEIFQLEENRKGLIEKDSQESFLKNKELTSSIKQWATDMDVNDEKLSKTRISHLFKDYKYWNTEVAEGNFKLASPASFRTYLVAFMTKNNIKNIFMRKIVVNKATKEKVTVDSIEVKQFDNTIYELSLKEKMEFVRASIRLVTRGHENALIISGMAGLGKSQALKDILQDEKAKVKWMAGGTFKNYTQFYKYFYDNNDKNTVIVFYDIDAVLDKKFLGIMNAVMAPEKKRIVSYPEDFKNPLPYNYESEFIFESKIIIATNKDKKKIPPSLVSRGGVIEIKTTPSDILDYIRSSINKVMAEYKDVSSSVKLEVLDFLEKIKGSITQIDFRLFKKCVEYRLTNDPNWKKWAMMIVRAI